MSIPLNISEGSAVRGGNRRLRYETALGSARETRTNIHVAVVVGYLDSLDAALDDQLDHIIATLVKLVRTAVGRRGWKEDPRRPADNQQTPAWAWAWA